MTELPASAGSERWAACDNGRRVYISAGSCGVCGHSTVKITPSPSLPIEHVKPCRSMMVLTR